MSVTIIDKMKQFIAGNAVAMDRALNRMAIDIERLSKEQVPLLKGQLRASGSHQRTGFLSYSVNYNKIYAAFQEFGGDGKRTVRNYSKAGTKAHYLGDAGRTIAQKALDYFKSEAKSINV